MNMIYGASGEIVGAEMTPTEYTARSASAKEVIDGIPHITVWCVVGQRVQVPVNFTAAFVRAAVLAASSHEAEYTPLAA